MQLSIIIPCYNRSQYIEQLITSLLPISQEKNIEIIFVDDYSQDDTLKLLNKNKAKFLHAKVIHNKKNYGLSNSRNIGIRNSIGKWLWFVDCDDILINHEYIISLVRKLYLIKEPVIHFPHKIINYKTHKISKPSFQHINSFSYSKFNHKHMNLDSLPWNKIFKREIFDTLLWPDIINEDVFFIIMLLNKGYSFLVFPHVLLGHHYNMDTSITQNMEKRRQGIITEWFKFVNMHIKEKSFEIALCIAISLTYIWYLNKSQYKKYKILVKKYKNNSVFKWAFKNSFVKKILYILLKMNLFFIAKLYVYIARKMLFLFRKIFW